MTTDCVWVSYHKPEILSMGYWDQAVLLDSFTFDYKHHDGFNDYWKNAKNDGAIVVINGRTHATPKDVARLNQDISALRWVVLIVTGDEESLFPSDRVRHPLLKLWIQLPRVNKHNDVYRLINGYRPDTHETLKTIKPMVEGRDTDWIFVGQIAHKRRKEMQEALAICAQKAETANGKTLYTSMFGGVEEGAMDEALYLAYLQRSKIAPCPSGPETPDTFRVWEALEAGCLPIVDSHSTNNPEPGFWEYLLGDDIPFPIVDEWSELPALLPQLLADYPANANKCFSWWQLLKRKIRHDLEKDATQWV